MFPSSTPRTMAKYQDSNLLTGDGAKIWYFFFFIIVFSLKLNIELLQRDLRQQFDYGELNGNPNFIFAIRNCTAGAEQKLQFRLRKARLGQLFLWKRSVERLWRAAKNSIQNGSPANVSSRMPKKIGRKKIQIDLEMMSLIPFRRRTNIRSTTKALGMSKTTVWRRIKDGSIKAHSNAIKPGFSLKTRIARLKHCLEMLDESVSPAVFSGMYDRIHIDEKWFYMSKTTQKYYLHPMEASPVRRCTSKNFIPKVMFLSALARPRYDEYVNTPFDGKIGMWVFVFMEAAKRKSKNRVAGTLEMKPIKSITQKVTREFLINKLLPAIIQKWPHDGRTIFI
ncbi:uncharacterized protein LOC113319535 [Papaver somniferum]|uniref:uncharacterized protein LOC113319535 n=1 Tax=Papaver somniferum TaxID=3469 RepID=UPI000E6FF9FF|nr:uncharacterized protein LOC113319535 [Papaver somniferum]